MAFATVLAITVGNTITLLSLIKRVDALEFRQMWISRRIGMKKWIEDEIEALEVGDE